MIVVRASNTGRGPLSPNVVGPEDVDVHGHGLSIRMFGVFEITVAGDPLPRMRTRKESWLLALLVMRAARAPFDRVRLAGALWPEASETAASYNLRRSLGLLREALGAQAHRILSPTPRTLRIDLAGDAFCDLLSFDAAIQDGREDRLIEAVSLYAGPLLPDCLEDWALADREARGRAALGALEALAGLSLKRGDVPSAISRLQQALQIDAHREPVLRLLMTALAEQGSYAEAGEVYRQFRLSLHRTLNAQPAEETVSLSRKIQAEARQRATTRAELPAGPTVNDARRSQLPRSFTRLVGRESERASVVALLESSRLVTLTGTGGVGKTRLSLAVAETLDLDYPDGAYFVDLAAVADAVLVPMAILSALGCSESTAQTPEAALEQFVSQKRLLIVFDNCEHVLHACALVARTLIRQCPEVRILSTSREALRVPFEVIWQVPGMVRAEAAQLFADRASQVRFAFELTAVASESVDRICARLEGIPLAIEMAAARTRGMSVTQIAAKLEDAFQLLNVPGDSSDPRHQTLRTTLDWSYGLLSQLERVLLSRLSVFVGGWTLEAAEAVCPFDAVMSHHDVLDNLLALVDRSLVTYAEDADGMGRYRLLETTRAYAGERLSRADHAALQTSLARYLLGYAEKAKSHWGTSEETAWLARLEMELPNIRACITAKLSDDPAADKLNLRLATVLFRFWWRRGHIAEGRSYLTAALAVVDGSGRSEPRAAALNARGCLARYERDSDAALADLQLAVEIRRANGDLRGAAASLHNLSATYCDRGDLATGMRIQIECIELYRAIGDHASAARNQTQLEAIEAGARAASEERIHGWERTLEAAVQRGDRVAEADMCGLVAMHFLRLGRTTESLTLCRRCLRIKHSDGDAVGICAALELTAAVLAEQGRVIQLPGLFAAAACIRESISHPLSPHNRTPYDENIAIARSSLGNEVFDRLWQEGSAMSTDQAVDFAMID